MKDLTNQGPFEKKSELFEMLADAFRPFHPQLTRKAPVKVDISALTFKPSDYLDIKEDEIDQGEQQLYIEMSADYEGDTIHIEADICMQYDYRKGSGRLEDHPADRYATFTPSAYELTVKAYGEENDYDINIDDAYAIVRAYIKKRFFI